MTYTNRASSRCFYIASASEREKICSLDYSKMMENYTIKKMIPLILLTAVIIGIIYILAKGEEAVKGGFFQLAQGLIMTAGLWIGCMAIVRYLWKRFPWERTPVRHLIYEIILIAVYVIVFALLVLYSTKLAGIEVDVENPVLETFVTFLITFLITAIHEAVFFYFQWKENFSKSVRLEKANIEARYDTLKAQVNPHFLFNSLNSLTSLVDDKPLAVKHIQNMSAFMRYLLNNHEKELVHLKEELEMVSNYIEIQKSRFGDALIFINEVEEKHHLYLIPPLSVEMLVENCIKHNIISTEKPLRIIIRPEGEKLVVENKKQLIKGDIPSTGHGLENIQQRYRFFTSRKMEIMETDLTFRVDLPLLTLSSQ